MSTSDLPDCPKYAKPHFKYIQGLTLIINCGTSTLKLACVSLCMFKWAFILWNKSTPIAGPLFLSHSCHLLNLHFCLYLHIYPVFIPQFNHTSSHLLAVLISMLNCHFFATYSSLQLLVPPLFGFSCNLICNSDLNSLFLPSSLSFPHQISMAEWFDLKLKSASLVGLVLQPLFTGSFVIPFLFC